jgi:hypothetical protein
MRASADCCGAQHSAAVPQAAVGVARTGDGQGTGTDVRSRTTAPRLTRLCRYGPISCDKRSNCSPNYLCTARKRAPDRGASTLHGARSHRSTRAASKPSPTTAAPGSRSRRPCPPRCVIRRAARGTRRPAVRGRTHGTAQTIVAQSQRRYGGLARMVWRTALGGRAGGRPDLMLCAPQVAAVVLLQRRFRERLKQSQQRVLLKVRSARGRGALRRLLTLVTWAGRVDRPRKSASGRWRSSTAAARCACRSRPSL